MVEGVRGIKVTPRLGVERVSASSSQNSAPDITEESLESSLLSAIYFQPWQKGRSPHIREMGSACGKVFPNSFPMQDICLRDQRAIPSTHVKIWVMVHAYKFRAGKQKEDFPSLQASQPGQPIWVHKDIEKNYRMTSIDFWPPHSQCTGQKQPPHVWICSYTTYMPTSTHVHTHTVNTSLLFPQEMSSHLFSGPCQKLCAGYWRLRIDLSITWATLHLRRFCCCQSIEWEQWTLAYWLRLRPAVFTIFLIAVIKYLTKS